MYGSIFTGSGDQEVDILGDPLFRLPLNVTLDKSFNLPEFQHLQQ